GSAHQEWMSSGPFIAHTSGHDRGRTGSTEIVPDSDCSMAETFLYMDRARSSRTRTGGDAELSSTPRPPSGGSWGWDTPAGQQGHWPTPPIRPQQPHQPPRQPQQQPAPRQQQPQQPQFAPPPPP